MGELTQQEAWDLLWAAKDYRNPKAFLWAELTEDVEMHEWNGTHPVEENTTVRVAKAGSTVLVTMASRFGDVGVRDDRLNPPSHGYYARVEPEKLTKWRDAPDGIPVDWDGPQEPEKRRSNLIMVEPNRHERRAERARNRTRKG